MPDTLMRTNALALIQSLLNDQIIMPQDLVPFVKNVGDVTEPEYLRQEMESWYRTLGIEALIGRKFSLKAPPFTRAELIEAYAQDEIIVCVPEGITRRQLATLFNLSNWVLEEELVPQSIEVEDFWFKTRCSELPDNFNKAGTEIQRLLDKEGKLGMTLNRYMAFAARMRYLTGKTPDIRHWTWLTRGRYDQKSMLIAGFDSNGKFSVHVWLPTFQGKLCGSRYVSIPDHL